MLAIDQVSGIYQKSEENDYEKSGKYKPAGLNTLIISLITFFLLTHNLNHQLH